LASLLVRLVECEQALKVCDRLVGEAVLGENLGLGEQLLDVAWDERLLGRYRGVWGRGLKTMSELCANSRARGENQGNSRRRNRA